MMKHRDYTLDSMKGLMIILVVFGHVSYVGDMANFLAQLHQFVYVFHMPIFLCISGYFYKPILDGQRAVTFIRQIIIPYFLFYVPYLLILFMFNNYSSFDTSNSVKSLSDIPYYLFANPLASYWYLHSLILFNLLFSTLTMYLPLGKLNLVYGFFLKGCFACIVVVILNYLGVKVFFWVFFYLLLGVLFRMYFDIKCLNKGFRGALFSIVFILVLLGIFSPEEMYYNFLVRLIVTMLIAIISVGILSKWKFYYLSVIGRSSIVIFLLHVYPINIAKLARDFFIEIEPSGLVYAMFATLLGVLLPLMISYITDQLKISGVLFGKMPVLIARTCSKD